MLAGDRRGIVGPDTRADEVDSSNRMSDFAHLGAVIE
jgi:hypothetical protein